MISFLIMTKDRIEETTECLLSIRRAIIMSDYDQFEIALLVNGGNQEAISELEKIATMITVDCGKQTICSVCYSKTNLGVAGGRNQLFSMAQGDILVFMDDDAELEQPDTFVDRLFDVQKKYPDVGAIAFKAVNPNGSLRYNEIPIKNALKQTETERLVSHFIGVGHAIFRKAVHTYSFLYPAELFYGMEEYYLSYRLLNDGFDIIYCPSLCVVHKKSPKTRLNADDYYIHLASNKIFIASLLGYKMLSISHFVLWSGWTFVKTKNVSVVFKMLKRLSLLGNLKGKYYIGIEKSCLTKVKVGGWRVWY